MLVGILILCVLVGFFHILSPKAHFKTQLPSTAKAAFFGRTDIMGSVHGFPISIFPENPFIDELSVFPMIGSITVHNIDTVTIINVDDISNTLSGYTSIQEKSIRFSNVTVVSKEPVFFGIPQGTINVTSDFAYAISTQISLSFQGNTYHFLAVISLSDFSGICSSSRVLLFPMSSVSFFQIFNNAGESIWEASSQNYILLLEGKSLTYTQQGSVYLLPVVSSDEAAKMHVVVRPAEIDRVTISSLMSSVAETVQAFNQIQLPSEFQELEKYSTIVASFLNGGMLLFDFHEQLYIDDHYELVNNLGFARCTQIDITISTATTTSETVVEGESRLFFLGTHLYTPGSNENASGIYLPFVLIAVWSLAGILFVYRHLHPPQKHKGTATANQKKYFLFLHIGLLSIVFILVDHEVYYQVGLSALSILMNHSALCIVLVLCILQGILWILGYLLLTVPLRSILRSAFQILGGPHEAKEISKTFSVLGIWVFCILYTQLFMNSIFFFIRPSTFFKFG